MDALIKVLPKHIGFSFADGIVNCLAFADDLILLASTKGGLQELLDLSSSVLRKMGLNFNTTKCNYLSLRPSGREKKMKVCHDSAFKIDNENLTAITLEDTFKYLGIRFSSQGKVMQSGNKLDMLLEKLKTAPLKPQQRLFILRVYLLPKFSYELVVGHTNIGHLNRLDRKVRSALRLWLRLPHDTPVGFFHASVDDGGLGVSAFRWTVPYQKLNRLEKLERHQLVIFQQLYEDRIVQEDVKKIRNWLKSTQENVIDSLEKSKALWSSKLYSSIDGSGLCEASNAPRAHKWISDGTTLCSGYQFVDMVRLRINALPTKSRVKRGRRGADTQCRAGCNHPETLTHILQRCHRTHDVRINRHDNIAKFATTTLLRRGFHVEREFLYRVLSGAYKPDIIAKKDNVVWVLDVHVIRDSGPLATPAQEKISTYNVPDLKEEILRKWKAEQIIFGTITISMRGVWERRSHDMLRRLGFSYAELKLMAIKSLQGGLNIFRTFNRMTTNLAEDSHSRRREV